MRQSRCSRCSSGSCSTEACPSPGYKYPFLHPMLIFNVNPHPLDDPILLPTSPLFALSLTLPTFILSRFASMDDLTQHPGTKLSLTDSPVHQNVEVSAAKYVCHMCDRGKCNISSCLYRCTHQFGDAGLSTKRNLKQHVESAHFALRSFKFACTVCGKSYRRDFDLTKHISRGHSIIGRPLRLAHEATARRSTHPDLVTPKRPFQCTWPGCEASKSWTSRLPWIPA